MNEHDLSHILNHLGEDREKYFNAVSPPIIQTSNFTFKSFDAFRAAMSDELGNHVYSRGNNPTVAILRKKMAALEKAEDALILGSGVSAIAAAVIGNVSAGDHVVCVQEPYSWTYKLLVNFLSRFGVSHTFVDGRDLEAIKRAVQPNTKVLYLESPNSLTFELQDLKACAAIAKENGLVSIIDNSYCSPYYQNPIEHGIDIVVHSGTKFINGHSDVVNGILCSSKAMVRKIFESEFMTLGMIISPHDASLIIRGLRTLPLRMERSYNTALKVIDFLKTHPKTEEVLFPMDPSFAQYDLAKTQMRGCAGFFTASFKAKSKGDMERFFNKLDRFLLAVSWGGHESLVLPISALYDIPGREDPNIPWNLVRFYIGLEEAEVLIEDLRGALDVL